MKTRIKKWALIWLVGCCCMGQVYAGTITADDYDKQLKTLYENKSWNDMKPLLEEALKRYPNDSDLNRWAGMYFWQQKDLTNARYFLIKAVRQDEESYQAKWQLATLEEEIGKLSSAICYVNELLELYPYDQALWKKKIGLYRKQGNHIEADRLLERLYVIYPTDSVVRKDYVNRLEEKYMAEQKRGEYEKAMGNLRTLLKYKPEERDYYLALSNMLLREGRSEEAVAALSEGLIHLPGDEALLRKKASILAERGNDKEAVDLLQKSRSGGLQREAAGMMLEAARKESWKDPYLLYGRVYDAQRSEEALDYLIRTSISRGYDEDALFYLNEYKRLHGEDEFVLYRQYRLHRRMGNMPAAVSTLEKLVRMKPTDTDGVQELVSLKLERADQAMARGNYADALTDLDAAWSFSEGTELEGVATRKRLDCLSSMNRHGQVVSTVDSLRRVKGDQSLYVSQKAWALSRSGRSAEALEELERNRMADSELYEEVAVAYLRQLLEEGADREAYRVATHWTAVAPDSKTALMYAVRTSEKIEAYDETEGYVSLGLQRYPQEPFFAVKRAAALYRDKRYTEGIDLLTPWTDSLSGNKEIVQAYAAHAQGKAEAQLKEKQTSQALATVDKALLLDAANPELWHLKGRIQEQAGDYQGAYQSYVHYTPPVWQEAEYRQMLKGVQRKGYRNQLETDLLLGWYADGGRSNTVSSISYTRLQKRDTFTGTVNLASRRVDVEEGEVSSTDNSGVQLRLDWAHRFGTRWTGNLVFAGANHIFPSWLGEAGISYYFPKDVELGVSVGYKKNYVPAVETGEEVSGNMYNLRLTSALYREQWTVRLNSDGYLLQKKPYFNLNAQARFYPLQDGHTHLLGTVGAGTAPESEFVDKLMPGSFEKWNLMVGVGGVYMVSKHVSLGLMATYYHFYNQSSSVVEEGVPYSRYKDLYNVYAQLIFSF